MAKPDSTPQPPVPPAPPAERLDSWKEIAVYVKREIRTVQRWEKGEGLPVHRHLHDRQGTVYAYKSELDAWWNNGRRRVEIATEAAVPQSRSRLLRWRVAVAAALLVTASALWFLTRPELDFEGRDWVPRRRRELHRRDDSGWDPRVCAARIPRGRYAEPHAAWWASQLPSPCSCPGSRET